MAGILCAKAGGLSARCICKRPSWESVYNGYPDGSEDTDAHSLLLAIGHWRLRRNAFSAAAVSAIRISLALINAGMKNMLDNAPLKIRNEQNRNHGSGFFADVKELKNWLEVVWGKAEEIGARGIESFDQRVDRIMKGRDGVVIIRRNGNFNYASLWEIDGLLDGETMDGDTVFFWELKGIKEHVKTELRKVSEKSINLAAIEGFKIISELSRSRRREICVAIYEGGDTEQSYHLTGFSIGNSTEVNPNREIERGRVVKAYIHTHVIEEEGAYFFSARDFYESYDRKVLVYMKHVNAANNRILKANNLQQNYNIGGAITAYRSHFSDRFPTGRELFIKADDGCQNRGFCFNMIGECAHFVLANSGHCLFGIFKRHGQEVFEIDVSDGSEKPFH